jgi:hypothetical protein
LDAATPPDEPAAPERAAPEEARTTKRLAFLAEAGRVLASSLDHETTLRSVARLATPRVADYCVVDLRGVDGSIRRVATAHRDEDEEERAAALRRFPPSPLEGTGVARVLRTGEPLLIAEVDDRALADLARGEEHLRVAR